MPGSATSVPNPLFLEFCVVDRKWARVGRSLDRLERAGKEHVILEMHVSHQVRLELFTA